MGHTMTGVPDMPLVLAAPERPTSYLHAMGVKEPEPIAPTSSAVHVTNAPQQTAPPMPSVWDLDNPTTATPATAAKAEPAKPKTLRTAAKMYHVRGSIGGER